MQSDVCRPTCATATLQSVNTTLTQDASQPRDCTGTLRALMLPLGPYVLRLAPYVFATPIDKRWIVCYNGNAR